MDIADMLNLKGIEIKKDFTYEDIVNKIVDIRNDYNKILSSFFQYQLEERNKFIYDIKRKIYSLQFSTLKKDKIWNYLNGYEYYYVLKEMLNKSKKK